MVIDTTGKKNQTHENQMNENVIQEEVTIGYFSYDVAIRGRLHYMNALYTMLHVNF